MAIFFTAFVFSFSSFSVFAKEEKSSIKNNTPQKIVIKVKVNCDTEKGKNIIYEEFNKQLNEGLKEHNFVALTCDGCSQKDLEDLEELNYNEESKDLKFKERFEELTKVVDEVEKKVSNKFKNITEKEFDEEYGEEVENKFKHIGERESKLEVFESLKNSSFEELRNIPPKNVDRKINR